MLDKCLYVSPFDFFQACLAVIPDHAKKKDYRPITAVQGPGFTVTPWSNAEDNSPHVPFLANSFLQGVSNLAKRFYVLSLWDVKRNLV